MNKREVIEEIIKTPKWYYGIWSQQTASAMIKRFNNGSLSDKKFKEIISKKGYKLVKDSEYEPIRNI